jgi:hypothetical protein
LHKWGHRGGTRQRAGGSRRRSRPGSIVCERLGSGKKLTREREPDVWRQATQLLAMPTLNIRMRKHRRSE